jgi:hypothetical protein
MMPGDRQQHPAVAHPVHLRIRLHRAGMGRLGKANDWAATHLAVMFGLVWTVWLFMTIPLLVLLAPSGLRSVVFYLASGWIQLWALPLFVFVGNKLQRSSDAQSEVMHVALSHVATVGDQNQQLLDQNTELTKQVHGLVKSLAELPPPPSPASVLGSGRSPRAGAGGRTSGSAAPP